MEKYTPPPKFKGQNADRGFTKEKQEKPKKSNQFPTTKESKEHNIRLPYND